MQLKTTPARSALMRRVRQRETSAESSVRSLLSGLGARYRVNVRGLPGSPDIANKSRRKAIFVHGCFWHHHPDCDRGRTPTRNADFWSAKFAANRERDNRKIDALKKLGFDVLVVWECEIESPDSLGERLRAFWYHDEVSWEK